ncbi:aldo/keto reductase [Actinophytocola xinjiangensis]|uniref:aldo/keto reductase n=1 Tax=Actinophytocola xinjiangensis TaxID=485602 RepID=UPI003CCBD875
MSTEPSLSLDRVDVVNLRLGDLDRAAAPWRARSRPLWGCGTRDRSGGSQPLTAERLDAVAARHGASVQQVALAWLLARSPNVLVIPGTGSVAHLEENVASGELVLTEEDIAELG